MRPLVAFVCALVLATAACGSTPKAPPLVIEDALLDPRPGQRTRAVAEVGRRGGTTHVPDLIELLDDPDPGVRMAAGATLKDLTGRDTRYEPWADAPALRRQLEAWRAWWSTQPALDGGPR